MKEYDFEFCYSFIHSTVSPVKVPIFFLVQFSFALNLHLIRPLRLLTKHLRTLGFCRNDHMQVYTSTRSFFTYFTSCEHVSTRKHKIARLTWMQLYGNWNSPHQCNNLYLILLYIESLRINCSGWLRSYNVQVLRHSGLPICGIIMS